MIVTDELRLKDPATTRCTGCVNLANRVATTSTSDIPSSAKIQMLLSLIRRVDETSQQREKIIVFSQFTSFLDLIEPCLAAQQIRFVRCEPLGTLVGSSDDLDDGKMRNDKRQEALETIKTSTSIRVILISLKAGSTGLNLTSCNNVVLMDPWWNPALEDQAFDRAHRLGQTLDVNIYKLCVSETVEDRE